MHRLWLAVAAVSALVAPPAFAEVKIEGVQAAYGPLGPERKTLGVQPQEEVVFRYRLTGLKPDANGRVKGELRVALTDGAGKEVLQDKSAIDGLVVLGGGTLPGTASVRLPAAAAPGEYTLTVTYKDSRSPRPATFQRKLRLKPAGFALLNPRFFHDAEHRVSAPAGGLLGQPLHFRLNVVGLDRAGGKAVARMEARVLGAEGEDVLARPIRAELSTADPEEVKRAEVVTFRAQMDLTRAGRYTLRITVADGVAGKKATFETSLSVTPP
jgi:hypothetical protein